MARARKAANVPRLAIVLLYNPRTGAIVHAHYGAADAGAKLPGRQALERDAVAFAKHRRAGAEKLARLHTDARAFRPDRAYKVDVRKRALIPASRRSS